MSDQQVFCRKDCLIIFCAIFSLIQAENCNFHATLFQKDSFYLTQQYTKDIVMDLSPYTEAFTELNNLVQKFSDNLEIYSNETALEEKEPMELIPFTEEQNAFRLIDEVQGTLAIKKCSENGGTLVYLNGDNRAKVAEILTAQNMEKTPFFALPFYSLLSYPGFKTFETPSSFDLVIEMWTKTPPYIGKDNVITYPTNQVKKEAEPGTRDSKPADFKSPVLCVKPNNLWDTPSGKSIWFKMIPKIKTAVSMLSKLKESFDLTTDTLGGIPKITRPITKWLKISIPESFQRVLDFLSKFKTAKAWELTTPDSKNQFYDFMRTAFKLVRTFELDPKSFIKIPKAKPKFALPSINNINWREHLGLDEEVYGLVGPIVITPKNAYEKKGGIDKLFKVEIKVRIYDRIKDKYDIYSVRPNTFGGEITTVKTVISSPQLKLALNQEVEPAQCEVQPAELFKLCHQLPFAITNDFSTDDLTSCAEALTTATYSPKFANCPRAKNKGPLIYRSECGPEKDPTIIVSTDYPLQVEFYCDGSKTASKKITPPITFIPTNCEAQILGDSSQRLVLPQKVADFLQDPVVGEVSSPDIPIMPLLTENQIIALGICGTVVAIFILIMLTVAIYKCCPKRRRREKLPKPQPPTIPMSPYPRFLAPALQLPDLRELQELS